MKSNQTRQNSQALESDLEHEAAVIADARATIQIPEQYADWYNKILMSKFFERVICVLSCFSCFC
jgi:bacterioferritin (cytochrome b1)